ncbi:pimeloyl-ACP methyl ester carboxylesterase [Tenacibaculum lutimaris]|uniref:Pimeloyl-ACP methyl ester carboxylesterase n=1 Tax=Tenacibaculum lutimaris TaxID=285258 RepID=A0A420E4X7_9FLAO|nr:alpha/beta hydrolase [Tenacibaculum lutimaris]RKF05234.1 pimeloyl-ACP methyl ester carboxylesterase [Tenacibaculum lutimaris]
MIVKFKETTVFYTDTGKGNSVVLLHGFLENNTMWNTVVEKISKRNRVICIDLLGHGKTGSIGYIHSMEEMAEAVKTVLQELKIRRAIFIGHSMGGYVALAFAEKYLKNVKGLCLLNSTSQADSEERKKLRLRANEMAKENYETLVKMSIGNLFAEQTREQFSEVIDKIRIEALKTPVRGYIAASEGMRLRENKEEVLQTIDKRLMIAGKQDSILSYESVVKESNRTNTPLVELPNGHMSHIEAKEELLEALTNFVKS